MVDNESSRPPENTESSPAAPKPEQSFRDVRHYVPQDILDVSFPVSLRGYDRDAVDAYVKRVNRVIAELKVSASPPAAVRHALDLAQEKVEALLQAAREAAEQITVSVADGRISRPGRRVYVGKDKIPSILGGMGVAILSTSRGVMTDRQSRKQQLGGEVLAYVW